MMISPRLTLLFALITHHRVWADDQAPACVGCFSEMKIPSGGDGNGDEAAKEALELRDSVLDFAEAELDRKVARAVGDGAARRCRVKILQVRKFETQVVAGTNFRLDFTAGCEGEGEEGAAKLRCREVVVYQPLPYACRQPQPEDNPRCLSVRGNMEEKCGAE